jgi:hypothetical protein
MMPARMPAPCVGCCFYTGPISQAATSLGHETVEYATIDAKNARLNEALLWYVRRSPQPYAGVQSG